MEALRCRNHLRFFLLESYILLLQVKTVRMTLESVWQDGRHFEKKTTVSEVFLQSSSYVDQVTSRICTVLYNLTQRNISSTFTNSVSCYFLFGELAHSEFQLLSHPQIDFISYSTFHRLQSRNRTRNFEYCNCPVSSASSNPQTGSETVGCSPGWGGIISIIFKCAMSIHEGIVRSVILFGWHCGW